MPGVEPRELAHHNRRELAHGALVAAHRVARREAVRGERLREPLARIAALGEKVALEPASEVLHARRIAEYGVIETREFAGEPA